MKETPDFEFLPLQNSNVPLYMQVYNYYKALITKGKLPPATKLPSIRRCAEALSVSRTTAEAAYLQLCADGYVLSRPQSGYYVTDLYVPRPQKPASAPAKKPEIRFDFASLSADRESFDFNLWRRYLKSALRQDERLLSYGEVQGEADLREAVAQYITEKRNVVCTPDKIVIGAGVQSLLHILCAVIGTPCPVAFLGSSFAQGVAIFRDHGFPVCSSPEDAKIIYTAPSHVNRWGDVMSTSERIDLLRNTAEKDVLLIEDDYDNEFNYFSRPAPALQGLDGGRRVIYLGTFSKLLLPSIRLSYMILPDALLPAYRKIAPLYNQTASKVEQIALCQFIRDGHLASQIRKVKKLYTQKALCLEAAVRQVFGEDTHVYTGETGFVVRFEPATPLRAAELARRAAEAGVAVKAHNLSNGKTSLLLSCSGVRTADYPAALSVLKKICENSDKSANVQN